MNDPVTFTGERLHEEDALFGLDLTRHLAAYQAAIRIARENDCERFLELGSGTGYGTRILAFEIAPLFAIDRVAPLKANRVPGAHYLRADLEALPITGLPFDVIASFQVIEHLTDPSVYLDAIARLLADKGTALITTPNAAFSDGENPFHVHEYEAAELEALLRTRFAHVEMLGVSALGGALEYHEDRLRRIRRITRLDLLGLRRRLPRALIEWLFAFFARFIRRGIAQTSGLPGLGVEAFPIEPAHPKSLDLFAVCREPRRP